MIKTLLESVRFELGEIPPRRLGVAVSGGGDSIALLSVLTKYAQLQDIDLHVVTVDHGLRPEAEEEISFVADLCAHWHLPHYVLHWDNWNGKGNLLAEARNARYTLITKWASSNMISQVVLGHTSDDQAETFIMRLVRGAGVDGLSAMASKTIYRDIIWVRPFLQITRESLRTYLRTEGLSWREDPSNENRDYQRIRVRDALTIFADLGLSVDNLVQVTMKMADAKKALNWQVSIAARDMVTICGGAVVIDHCQFQAQPYEIKRRLLAHSIQWSAGNVYSPRGPAVFRVMQFMQAKQTSTLNGCQILTKDDLIYIFREYNAVRDISCATNQIWDKRWMVFGSDDNPSLFVRALGFSGIRQTKNWRDIGLPRAALLSTPSVWCEGDLLAAPIVLPDEKWTAFLQKGEENYFAALLSH
jgi:tRNA(Ile)-lysidine synthase